MGRAHGFHACKYTGMVLHAYYPDFGSSYPSFCVLGAPILMNKPESAGRSRQGPTFHHRKTLNYNLLLCQIRNLRVVLRCANRVRERQRYFQEKRPCLKNNFPTLEKVFSCLEKIFSCLGKKFSSVGHLFENNGVSLKCLSEAFSREWMQNKRGKGGGARFFCSSQPAPLPKCSHFSPLEWGIIALQSMPLL